MKCRLRDVLAAGLAAACLVTPAAFAGDEVDYSAPYLVVEDGKLVTKYPNQEHQAAAPAGDEADTAGEAAGPTEAPAIASDGPLSRWLIGSALFAIAAGGLFFARRARA